MNRPKPSINKAWTRSNSRHIACPPNTAPRSARVAAKTFDEANAAANDMLTTVTRDATAWMINRGISLDFLGYADTFSFDPAVQEAIDDQYRAKVLGPLMPTLQALAQFQVYQGLSKGLDKHGPPVVLTPNFLHGLIAAITQPAVATEPPPPRMPAH